MEPIIVFLLCGVFPMSAAIAASKLMKMPEEERPAWVREEAKLQRVVMLGNLFGLVLIAALWYGFTRLEWWIPVLCLVLTFPVIHLMVIERLFGLSKSFMFSGALSLASPVLLWLHW
ncbi:hypothetical protein DV711_09745 [Motiliproteus coralliicola]|uniref:DUF3325 domain-containing protein n=1 Tax=Motiliproteus coralliicola TaxID=2283196 RepID=A0A369WP44_9GAMM|nr:hypothetical protein [Motiliproteus coralliicola]RDE22839.1 hypothetical protein DV711_09745 [Motiliproteus coralliicola]